MGMSIRQYKVKKEKIEKQNFSIEDFTWRFNHFVSNPKELKMTGFVGKIHGNMFWVKYYPEHVTIKNLFELYSRQSCKEKFADRQMVFALNIIMIKMNWSTHFPMVPLALYYL